MKTYVPCFKTVVAVLFGWLPLPLCSAANLSLSVSAASTISADSAYPGSGSTVSTAVDNPTGIIATVFGRDYGVNPAAGGARWGVRAGALPSRPNQTGIVVSNGFSPAAPGSTVNAAGTGASYISIVLANVQPNTLFQNISIDFQGLTSSRTTNAWGAASVGNFTNWVAATFNGSGNQLSVNLADFTFTGGPLEFRIYGVDGQTEGYFSSIQISAKLGAAPAIPEPGCLVLVGMGLAVIFGRRQR